MQHSHIVITGMSEFWLINSEESLWLAIVMSWPLGLISWGVLLLLLAAR